MRNVAQLVDGYVAATIKNDHATVRTFCAEDMQTVHHMGESSLSEMFDLADRLTEVFGRELRIEKWVIADKSVTIIWKGLAWSCAHMPERSTRSPDHQGLMIEVLDVREGQFTRRWLVHDMQFYVAQLGW